ncbi:LOW QUALITY PROTEIN: hypothetical protein OSB04_013988 [Centaurea solstitialis]|uniref:non-specific serine/threonine protein kinase n=1 Tax=Centaurea solstitialis TaxID=347529 RepID=A0AA38TG26_9ASTR|nr:LOW QUALITY PROTEIN: hypothetical protein OSB04_013988 [Centaurea solstitialis]
MNKMHFLSIIFMFCILSSISTGDETDHLALLSIKKHITSDPYQIMPLWNDSIHFCNWTGIACSLRHQRVVSLDLESRGFSGSISPAIGNLSFLRELMLRNNSFTGYVPQEVGRLSRLRRLHLSNNSLSGEIPSNISRCQNLVQFGLSRNKFIGVIPNEFESLTKLVYIDLGYNELTGEIPKYIGNFTSLEVIYGSQNNFQGNIPDSLGQLSNLWFFGFASNNLSGILPLSFFNISSLKEIHLLDNQIGGNLPSDIAQRFLGLTDLNLPINKFSGPIPLSLSNATYLENLALNQNSFTGSVPNFSRLQRLRWFAVGSNQLGNGKSDNLDFVSSLANCTKLTWLGFGFNNLGGVLPRSIFNFTLLTSLRIERNLISGNIPYEIGKLVNIERLMLSYNQFNGIIPDSIGNLRNLVELTLKNNLLSGSIPSSLGNLTQLITLFLDGNKLEGTVPSGLSNCKGLQNLDLSRNNLSGYILKGIFGLSSLTIGLDLSNNRFVGSLPAEVGTLQNLVAFDVSNNMISGAIPVSLGTCTSLVELVMAGNNFQGELPTSIRSLRGLEVLDLSRNNFTGRIPEYLGDFMFLNTLNLSLNGFDGKLPEEGAFRNVSKVSIYGNAKLCGGLPEFQLPKCSLGKSSRKKQIPLPFLITIPIISVLFVLIVVAACFVCKLKRKKASTESSSEDGNFQQVSYQSLHEATDGFSSANLIAMCIRQCCLQKIEPEVVAVKVLKLAVHGADRSFIAECEALRSIRHRNLVKVVTCCSSLDFQGNDFKALVYSYMVNGSLEDWLHQNSVVGLNFLQRLNIAIDLAGALDYIHRQCGSLMIHCDIKPSNVLLDADLVAHLGDFGLARFVHPDSSTSHTSSLGIKGTIGYAAPEYGMGSKVSTYGDVYSFGILVLELFTGKRPTAEMFSDGLSLHGFVKMAIPDKVMEITDPVLFKTSQEETMIKDARGMEECLTSVYQIGSACSMEIPRDRIEISDALNQLQVVKRTFLKARFFTKIATMNKMHFLSIIFMFCILSSISTGDETDHLALLSIKKHITSDPYQIMPLWNDSIHFCNWTGIACSLRHQRVVSLDLESRGFSGSISPAIGNLSFLRELMLRNNSFTGYVPQEVGRLSRLRRLHLSNNSLSGEIPSNISRCQNLVQFGLSRNKFIGVIPNEFESLTKLLFTVRKITSKETFQIVWANCPICGFLGSRQITFRAFYLYHWWESAIGYRTKISWSNRSKPSHKKFSGPIPLSLSNATYLENLALNQNSFTGSVPNFSRLQRLRWFAVGSNKLGNGKSDNLDFVSSLANCTKLTWLGFGFNNLGGVLPRSIFNFTLLTSLRIERNLISGNIPYEIGKLIDAILQPIQWNNSRFNWKSRNLVELTLKNNLLSGSIPSSLGNLTQLITLFLDGNKLEGTVPSGIFGLSSLTIGLDLSNNRFVGSLPAEVGTLQNLVAFDLVLELARVWLKLFMAGNNIQGEIPTSFRSLRGLEVLDLSRNNLTGRIPEYLGDFVFFKILNLSFNGFEGKLPEQGAFKNVSEVSIYGNAKLCGGLPEFQLPKCSLGKSSRKKQIPLSFLITIPIISVGFVLIVVAAYCFVCKLKRKKASTEIRKDGNFQQVSYQSLHEATDEFSSANLIGFGKFSYVYKAMLPIKNEPQVVAVKVLKLAVHGADRSFIAECEALRSIRHRNLVKVLTCCSSLDFQGNDFKALVYSYMVNGSLEDWLHHNRVISLNFLQRLNIVIDLAGALDYIHRQCGSLMIHCDIKPSNVLLDTDLVAHLGDFGLARFVHRDSSTRHTSSLGIKGTIGYAAPEYGMGGKVSTYGDIYSFGILILELFTGKRPTEEMFVTV